METLPTENQSDALRQAKLRNNPGEPILTRDKGAKFYCVVCEKTYQKCKCRVYMSADTLKREKQGFSAQHGASG